MGNYLENLNINYSPCYTATGNVVGINLRKFMQDNQNQTHWIYAAAIMDSDGCFMITRSKSRSTNKDHYDYTPRAKVTMVYHGSINYIFAETKLGKINICGVRPSRPNSLPLFTWEICNLKDLMSFIEGVLPYLKIKKERALHLLDFCKNRLKKKIGNRYIKPDKEELDYRNYMYQKMRELNGNKVGATTKPREHESACDSLNSMET